MPRRATIACTAAPSPATYGGAVSLKAPLSGANGTPTGTSAFDASDQESKRAPPAVRRGRIVTKCLRSMIRVGWWRTILRRLDVALGTAVVTTNGRETLPRARTRFFGRTEEMQAIAAALSSGARVVTLVGAPGIGKTRLAQEFAWESRSAGRSVAYASLSDATTAEQVAGKVADSLDVEEAALAAELGRAGPLTLVLDNVEQVAGAVASSVDTWMVAAPDAVFVCTSRVRLKCRSSRSVAIEIGPLSAEDALALLLDRAAGRFECDAARRDVLGAIVQRLDRIPLAIELAAGRSKILTAEELLARIGERLDLGHRGLHAAIDTSWDALERATSLALALAGVFRGGFSLEAFESVVAPLLPAGAPNALEIVGALCEASLLAAFDTPRTRATTRFGMYEAIREYAWDRLDETERARVSRAHEEYFGHFAESRAETLDRVALESDNLSAAFESALATGSDRATRIALALDPLARMRGPLALHEDRLGRALARGGLDPHLQARASVARANVRSARGDVVGALRDLADVQRIVDVMGYGDIESEMLAVLSIVMQSAGHLDEGIALLEAKIDRSESPDLVLRSLGVLRLSRGELEQALATFERALEIAREIGHVNHIGGLMALAGMAHQELGNLARSREVHEAAIAHAHGIGDDFIEAVAHNWFGQLLLDVGDLAGARRELESSRAILGAMGEGWFCRATIGYLGILDHYEGNLAGARALLEDAVTRAKTEGDHYRLGNFGPHYAAVRAALGDAAGARASFAEARDHAAASPCPNLLPITAVLESFVDRTGAPARIARAETAAARSSDVRLAMRMVKARLPLETVRRRSHSAVSASSDGSWFALGDAERCDLSHRVPTRRILACLLEQHRRAPGAGVSSERLIAAGWPGEHVLREAGLHRVHVAIATLRRLGLGNRIVKQSDGYRLDVGIEVIIVDSDAVNP